MESWQQSFSFAVMVALHVDSTRSARKVDTVGNSLTPVYCRFTHTYTEKEKKEKNFSIFCPYYWRKQHTGMWQGM